MKKYIVFLSIVITVLTACTNDKKGSAVIPPQITNVDFSAESYAFGEEVIMTIHSKGIALPLSTVSIKSILDEKYSVGEGRVRAYGYDATSEYRVKAPLIAKMNNTKMKFLMQLEDIEGNSSTSEASVEIVRPILPLLYIVMQDGNIKIMNRSAVNPDIFTIRLDLPKAAQVRFISRLDETGFNWGWSAGDNIIVIGELNNFIPLGNSTEDNYQIEFNIYDFSVKCQL